MNKTIYYWLMAIVFLLIGWFANTAWHLPKNQSNPISQIIPKPLEKYSIENLSKKEFLSSQIKIDGNLFSFLVDGKKVTGQINIPEGDGPFPVIVMFRGYVDQKIYKTGDGTRRAAEFFSKNGFITIAPDFLGYGGSDSESENIFESRFQTYTTALTLLASLQNNQVTNLPINKDKIFLWGHSNGGQIALTVLEITQASYPTVLWAPVSKPFPYSILYYTDDSDDHGKLIRSELSKFEANYDVEKYSLTNYFSNIKAPISLKQGTSDDAVPYAWSDLLKKNLESNGVNVQYTKYPGVDHNMNPDWSSAVFESLQFYKKFIQ